MAKALKPLQDFVTPRDDDAVFQMAQYLHNENHHHAAEILYKHFIALNGDHSDAIQQMAILAAQCKQYEKSDYYFRKAIRINPRCGNYYYNYAIMLENMEKWPEVVANYNKGLQYDPNHERAEHAQYNVGIYYNNKLGRPWDAIEAYKKCVERNPDNPHYHMQLGVAYQTVWLWDDAIAEYKFSLQYTKQKSPLLCNLGVAYQGKGDLKEAEKCFLQAIEESGHAISHNNLGNLYKDMDRTEDALQQYNAAITQDPKYIQPYGNQALVLRQIGRYEDALEIYDQMVPLMAENDNTLYNTKAELLAGLGRYREAEEILLKRLNLFPRDSSLLITLAKHYHQLKQYDQSDKYFMQCAKYVPNDTMTLSAILFFLSRDSRLPAKTVFEYHRQWDKKFGDGRHLPRVQRSNSLDRDRKLKVGYISGDFRNHSVSFFFRALLENHNRDEVDVSLFSNSMIVDDVAREFREKADNWFEIAGKPDRIVAELIAREQIDILVDLAGHTAHNSLALFPLRPAPIQCTYMGYNTTSGLRAMDYWITDEVLHPDNTTEMTSETIWRLPRCWMAYTPYPNSPEVAPSPFLNNGFITFGSFNSFTKISDINIETWCNLLKRMPEAKFLLKTKEFTTAEGQEIVLGHFAQHGIGADRFIIRGDEKDHGKHLGRYGEIDIALDTFPNTGATTTCDALWMGVPVVSLQGPLFVNRMSSSLLTAMGYEDMVVTSREAYIEKAIELANDKDRLVALRKDQRERMAASAVCDKPGLAKAFDDSYRQMWHTYVDAQERKKPKKKAA